MSALDHMENETSTSLIEDADIERVLSSTAPLNVDILLLGETGTGKDTLAQRIHRLSGRRGNLVAVNCAAIPETLAESQLFGVNSGAYTGAVQSRAGFIEAAHLGTLYLDEIDSLPLSLQAKLLRVLEARGVERLGST
ncbi:AAA domain-containing protein, partial [Pseudomonas syringae]|uniref:sigma 54-interacting transcriptional regulator n=2 Tax=Pseudomonas TaxID=286 RepID=UPI001F8CCAFF